MSYLIYPEFKRFIQIDNLNQIINNDQTILIDAILDAQSVAMENLIQRYLIADELTDTNIYDITETYVPGNRVYLDAATYDQTLTYVLGTLTLKDKVIYKCSVAIVVPENFNSSHWTALGPQYSIWYVPYPAVPVTLFDVNAIYSIGDKVFRLGKTYTCLIATMQIDHTTLLQAYQYSNVPLTNIFPEDPVYGLQYWGAGVAVTVTPASLPSGFNEGDNRSRNLVRHLIAITLFFCHDRISPRNIPQLREIRHKEAMAWLKDAKEGNITTDIAVIQPRAGGRIRWGSKIRNINSY